MASRRATTNPKLRRRLALAVMTGLAILAAALSVNTADLESGAPDSSSTVDFFLFPNLTPGEPSNTTSQPAPRGEPSEVQSTPCPFDTTYVTEVECGRVAMPGRGDDPNFSVEISFARFHTTGQGDDVEPDPVVYLHGGPGSHVLVDADAWYDSIVGPHIETRDVIIYDQRGAGESSPLPPCTVAETVMLSSLYAPISYHQQVVDVAKALADCAERRFGPSGIDPTAFSTIVNTQDLIDLMEALDITEYNLHGSSYGTHLAQAIMRDAPDGVRSVVLSGVYPTDVDPFESVPATLEIALDAVFDGCDDNEACHQVLPDPWASLETLVTELNRDPTWIMETPGRGVRTPTTFNGVQLLDALQGLLYTRDGAATIPDLLIDAEDGDQKRLRRLAESQVGFNRWLLTGLLVMCADEDPFPTDPDELMAASRPYLEPGIGALGLFGPHLPTYCDALGVEWIAGIQDDPVTWDVPTLILSGAADPITPAAWARQLAARLPRSRLVVNPAATHDSDDGWCSLGLIGDFVARPDRLLDVWCASSTSQIAPANQAVRFANQLEGSLSDLTLDGIEPIELVMPDFWEPVWLDEEYLLWRALDTLDPTVFAVFSPTATTDFIDLVGGEGYDSTWVEQTSDLTPRGWVRSIRQGLNGTLIRYLDEATGVAVAVRVEPDDPDAIEANVLVPAAQSFRRLP